MQDIFLVGISLFASCNKFPRSRHKSALSNPTSRRVIAFQHGPLLFTPLIFSPKCLMVRRFCQPGKVRVYAESADEGKVQVAAIHPWKEI